MAGPDVQRGVTVILVRHGQTAWNAARRFLGQTDIGLDAVGRVQARRLVAVPEIARASAVYASPLRRARQTADLLGRAVTVVPGLEELHQGRLEGLEVAEAIARHPTFFAAWARDPTGVAVPGGESLDAARDRALAALDAVAADQPDGSSIVVVSHQLVIAAVSTWAYGVPLRSWRRYGLPNTGTRTLRWEGGRWCVDHRMPHP